MGLRSDPVGGGQFKTVVNDIIQQERIPIRSLEARKAKETARLQLFNQFKSKFGELQKTIDSVQNFSKLKELKVDLGDGKDLVDITLDKERARPGVYEISVDQLAKRSGIISNGFNDPNENVMGIGWVQVYTEDSSFEVFIDEDHSSLNGIARAINDVKDSPITAEVIRDYYDADNPHRLIIKAKKDGYFNEVQFPDFYFFGGKENFWIEDEREADNAYLKVDGFEIEGESNEIKDFLDGVNLRLKQARPDQPFTISIAYDNAKVAGKIKEFVDKANEVLKFINDQHKVDEKTDTAAMFTGDTGIQTIEYRLRNLLHEGFPVGEPDSENFRTLNLSRVGVEFGRDGQLKFDEKKFEKALADDFDGIAEAISGEYGFAFQMGEVLRMYTRPLDGLLAMKEKAMQSRINQIDRNIEQKERLLERKTQNLVDRFARLQASLGGLQQQQAYMQSALGSMGGGGNLMSQLLGGG